MTPSNESTPLLPEPLTERPGPPARALVSHSHLHSHKPDHDAQSHSSASSSTASRSHSESHADYASILRDVIIGFSDGLTVPFALTAGLSSLGSAKLVIMGGLAELFSGMISMGLGAYLAAATERDHFASEKAREQWEVINMPDAEREEVFTIMEGYGISRAAAKPLVEELCKNHDQWVRFMLDFELKLEDPHANRAWISAVTMGVSYFVGGLIPMLPYFVMERVQEALWVSIAITVVILLAFGYGKNWISIRTHRAGVRGAFETLVIGVLAAGTSYAIVRSLDSKGT